LPNFLNISTAFAAVAAAVLLLSGGSSTDPRTPPALRGLPPPFLGTAIVGHGRAAAAVDAYGNVVDLRVPGPTGRARVEVEAERQAAGSVSPDAAVVAQAFLAGRSLPFWHADTVRQRYLRGTNVLRTVARFGDEAVTVMRRAGGPGAARADRGWIARARPLGAAAPRWAAAMYERSLLVLRALTDRRSGAVAAGAREGWAYVWPRDAGAVAFALASSGYRAEARRVARFLLGLDLGAAARFRGSGEPVGGRAAQGDASGWVGAAARAAGLIGAAAASRAEPRPRAWTGRADYQEKGAGNYLANSIASGVAPARIHEAFATPRGLVREEGEMASGLDTAAAWAVRPFPRPALFPAVRRTLLHLAAQSDRFGIVPSEDWTGGTDPWTAPTAWSAWSLAALARGDQGAGSSAVARRERRAALGLLAALRRAATPLGLLPERVDAETGLPVSTTPLAWSHAFAILALRELWPGRAS
jgi:glucoamylase